MNRTICLLSKYICIPISLLFISVPVISDSTYEIHMYSSFVHDSIRQKCNRLRWQNAEREAQIYTIHGVVNQRAQIGAPVLLASGPREFPRYEQGYTMVYFVDYNSYVNTYNNAKEFKELLNASPSSFTIRLFRSFDSSVPDDVATSLEYYSRITGGMAELAFVPDIEPGLYVLVCKVQSDIWGDKIRPIASTTSNLGNYLLIVEGSVNEERAKTEHVESKSVHSRVKMQYVYAVVFIALILLIVIAIALILRYKYQVAIVIKERKK